MFLSITFSGWSNQVRQSLYKDKTEALSVRMPRSYSNYLQARYTKKYLNVSFVNFVTGTSWLHNLRKSLKVFEIQETWITFPVINIRNVINTRRGPGAAVWMPDKKCDLRAVNPGQAERGDVIIYFCWNSYTASNTLTSF